MGLIRLYLDCLLRPVFEKDVKLIEQDDCDSSSSDEENHQNERDENGKAGRKSKLKARNSSARSSKKRGASDDMLDLNGPKLIEGAGSWLLLYRVLGHLNWSNQPLYISILYKLVIAIVVNYLVYVRFIRRVIALNIIDENYRNPIFIFISLLAVVSSVVQSTLSVYTNLFHLCPMFKIITTPKLCFISKEVQTIAGSETFKASMLLNIYRCLLISMFVCENLEEFLHQFTVYNFLIDLFALVSGMYYLVGMTYFDFYIRSTFGFWLLAMKFNLEHRFTFLHKYNTRRTRRGHKRSGDDSCGVSEREDSVSDSNNNNDDDIGQASQDHRGWEGRRRPESSHSRRWLEKRFTKAYKFITLDEIQKSLNNMDDHLEVWRSIQTSSLVFITLNAFLTNGALLLLAYQLLANQGNYYHGLLLMLIAVDYTIMIFFCYVGDSWISYALSSFVQTVEDEYFLQGAESELIMGRVQSQDGQAGPVLPTDWQRSQDQPDQGSDGQMGAAKRAMVISSRHQSLLIRKNDVLFCREFLHQFENHLATQWSKLTVKTHLHMLGTFVTLIAAQIIFDHEH